MRRALAIALLMLSAFAAQGEEDPRFVVELAPAEQGAHDLRKIVHQAAERLWQRILPHGVPSPRVDALRLLKQVKPQGDGWRVVFERKRTLDWLAKAGYAVIEHPVRIALSIQVQDAFGNNPALASWLMQQAARIADEIGVVLAEDGMPAPLLVQWTEERIGVLIGKEPLGQRAIAPGTSSEQAAVALLREVLLAVRDRAARPPAAARNETAPLWVRLVVARPMPLFAQIDWERALMRAGFVRAVMPMALSQQRRIYLVGLADADGLDALGAWLAQQGLHWHMQALAVQAN